MKNRQEHVGDTISEDQGLGLYRRYTAGDERALEAIIELYSDGLFMFVNGYVECDAEAEDILSDTFMKIIMNKHKFREESSFKTYLYRIGRNGALDCLKRNRYQAPISEDLQQDKGLSPEEQYFRDERAHTVNKAINSLNTQYRDVLYLTYFEGMKNSELCIVLHKSRKQIENLLFCAKNALKQFLERNGISYEDI